jgi:lipopolysaccharide export LptBFGC system permease protein LptF
MTLWIIVAILYYTLFIITWVKGLGAVKEHQPEGVVKFYFVMAMIRFVMALTIVALYMLFSDHTQGEAAVFCVTFSAMYVIAIVVSVALKH